MEDGFFYQFVISCHPLVSIFNGQIAELFDTSKQNIGQHVASVLQDKELDENSVVKCYFTTAADGKDYNVRFYSLDMILAIGFRVRSKRGTQFRIWANQHLKQFLVKGFDIDDERLKNPDGRPDYFDELRKQDIYIAKNYLTHDEIDSLNRLTVLFLDSAELRVKERLDLTLDFWRNNVDALLNFQNKNVLRNAGHISNKQMESHVSEIYDEFALRRKKQDAIDADKADMEELRQIEQEVGRRG